VQRNFGLHLAGDIEKTPDAPANLLGRHEGLGVTLEDAAILEPQGVVANVGGGGREAPEDGKKTRADFSSTKASGGAPAGRHENSEGPREWTTGTPVFG
jgi:hypothetical protein